MNDKKDFPNCAHCGGDDLSQYTSLNEYWESEVIECDNCHAVVPVEAWCKRVPVINKQVTLFKGNSREITCDISEVVIPEMLPNILLSKEDNEEINYCWHICFALKRHILSA